jgi:hypothetical protein
MLARFVPVTAARFGCASVEFEHWVDVGRGGTFAGRGVAFGRVGDSRIMIDAKCPNLGR